jgi:predicted deacylase
MRRYEVVEGEVKRPPRWRKTEYYTHVRGKGAGIIHPEPCLKAEAKVKRGYLLCRVLDFLGEEIDRVHAPHDGIILMEPNAVSVGPESSICLLAHPPKYFT